MQVKRCVYDWVTTGLNLDEKYSSDLQVPWQYNNYVSVSLLHVTCFLCINQCVLTLYLDGKS